MGAVVGDRLRRARRLGESEVTFVDQNHRVQGISYLRADRARANPEAGLGGR